MTVRITPRRLRSERRRELIEGESFIAEHVITMRCDGTYWFIAQSDKPELAVTPAWSIAEIALEAS